MGAARAVAVERLRTLTPAQFRSERVAASRPFVLVGGAADWPATRTWTVPALVERLGDRPVVLASAPDGVFSYDTETTPIHYEQVPFREAARRVSDDGRDGRIRHYVMQRPLEPDLPELAGDVPPLTWLTGEIHWPHFWMGGAGLTTPLHWDNLHNLYAQVIGRKRVVLFSPDDFDVLYPYPATAHFSHMSFADPDDVGAWPDVGRARRMEATLSPGDLLFIPAFWWHHVRSLDLSVNVNYWWAPKLAECYVPAFLRVLRAYFERERLAGLGAPVTTHPGGRAGAARASLVAGQPAFAVLLAAAELEWAVRRLAARAGVPDQDEDGFFPLETLVPALVRAGVWPAGGAGEEVRLPCSAVLRRVLDDGRHAAVEHAAADRFVTEALAAARAVDRLGAGSA